MDIFIETYQEGKVDIEEIIEEYSAMIYRIAMTSVRKPEDAEDILQETFLKLHQNRTKKFENRENIKAWLIRVTINFCKIHYRNNWVKKVVTMENNFLDNKLSYYPKEMQHDYDLLRLLLSLPEKYRTIVYLYYFEEYSIKELENILKLKSETIRTRLHRGREMMRKQTEGKLK